MEKVENDHKMDPSKQPTNAPVENPRSNEGLTPEQIEENAKRITVHKPKENEPIFKIDGSFNHYVRQVGYDENVPENTMKKIRHSYFAGCAQMYVLFTMHVAQHKAEDQQKMMTAIANELNRYSEENEDRS